MSRDGAVTKSDILRNVFGQSMWLNRSTSKKLVDGMSDQLCDAVIESLEAIRICNTVSGCMERFRVPNNVRGMTLKLLEDDVCEHAYCVEELNLDTCKSCGIHFNRKFAEDIIGCSSEELLTRCGMPSLPLLPPRTSLSFSFSLSPSLLLSCIPFSSSARFPSRFLQTGWKVRTLTALLSRSLSRSLLCIVFEQAGERGGFVSDHRA